MGSRFAGRNGRIYLSTSGAGDAEYLNFIASWELNLATDKFDVTAFGDENKTTVAGLPAATGTFTGWMDDTTYQAYDAAVDGQARKFYLYPSFTSQPSKYFFGTINLDASYSAGVDGAGTFSGSWEAASKISKN
ncbi:MAG TPA: hypothetical protein VF174_14545 [Micromonosporaceae bacterium]